MEEMIEEFANIFAKSLIMLKNEVEINRENNIRLYQVEELAEEWNNLYEKYFENGI